MIALFVGFCACILGGAAGVLLERLIAHERRALELPASRVVVIRWRPVAVALLTGVLAAAIHFAEVQLRCVASPEVQPPIWAEHARAVYHGVLAGLLVLAMTIDLDCYLIPDVITTLGMFCGVLGAAASGDLQIAHLWVDWSQAIPQLQGPYIPAWYDTHRHLHGLAWSLTGLACGAVLTLTVRAVAGQVLGQESMGLGDVTLMAMIGSFLGWQAVVLTFALAPLVGMLAAVLTKLLFNRPYLPYGPCLGTAALVVVFNWSRLWQQTRLLFSDLVGLLMLSGAGIVVMVLLLGMFRLYRNIPTGR